MKAILAVFFSDASTPVRTEGESKCVSTYKDLRYISTVKFFKTSCFSDDFVDLSDLSDLDDFKVNKVSYFPLDLERCDGTEDCRFGEDQYLCDYSRSTFRSFPSRKEIDEFLSLKSHSRHFSPFPTNLHFTSLNFDSLCSSISNDSSLSAYSCNRGVGVLLRNISTVLCYCPPQYCGDRCQFHSDRLSGVLQSNFSSSSSSRIACEDLLKLIVVFSNETMDEVVEQRNEFHLYLSKRANFISQFVFSRSSSSIDE